jgi:hypothetical protein
MERQDDYNLIDGLQQDLLVHRSPQDEWQDELWV